MRGEGPFLTCGDSFHSVICKSQTEEPVCTKCGLVFDEMKLDFLIELNTAPKRGASRPRMCRSSRDSLKYSPLERSLRELFFEKNPKKIVQDKALELCDVVRKQEFHTGYPVSTLSRALVYIAHRLCSAPTTLAECAGARDCAGN